VLCSPDQLEFCVSDGILSNETTFGSEAEVSIEVHIEADGYRLIICLLTFVDFPKARCIFFMLSLNSESSGNVRKRFATLLKCPFQFVKVFWSDLRAGASQATVANLVTNKITVRVFSQAVFFRLHLPLRLERITLAVSPPTVSRARILLSKAFALNDTAGLTFKSRSSAVAEDGNLSWYSSTESVPIDCEALYETWFKVDKRPTSWVHGGDATVEDAISELNRRYFSVASLSASHGRRL
jgi:hypothetical protein